MRGQSKLKTHFTGNFLGITRCRGRYLRLSWHVGNINLHKYLDALICSLARLTLQTIHFAFMWCAQHFVCTGSTQCTTPPPFQYCELIVSHFYTTDLSVSVDKVTSYWLKVLGSIPERTGIFLLVFRFVVWCGVVWCEVCGLHHCFVFRKSRVQISAFRPIILNSCFS
jgi:hypothetical protein